MSEKKPFKKHFGYEYSGYEGTTGYNGCPESVLAEGGAGIEKESEGKNTAKYDKKYDKYLEDMEIHSVVLGEGGAPAEKERGEQYNAEYDEYLNKKQTREGPTWAPNAETWTLSDKLDRKAKRHEKLEGPPNSDSNRDKESLSMPVGRVTKRTGAGGAG